MIVIMASVIVSAITAKIVAAYYFKKIDGYAKEMCEMTTKSNEQTLAILHKLHKNSFSEELGHSSLHGDEQAKVNNPHRIN